MKVISEKSHWDALKHCVSSPDKVAFCDSVSFDENTEVSEVPTCRDLVAAVFGNAVMVDKDETEVRTCELERESQVVIVKQAVRALLSTVTHLVLRKKCDMLICTLLR